MNESSQKFGSGISTASRRQLSKPKSSVEGGASVNATVIDAPMLNPWGLTQNQKTGAGQLEATRVFLAEFIGSYIAYFLIYEARVQLVLNGYTATGLFIGLVAFFAFAAPIALFAGISTAQFNPMLAFVYWWIGKDTWLNALLRTIVQIAAGVVAGVTIYWHGTGVAYPTADLAFGPGASGTVLIPVMHELYFSMILALAYIVLVKTPYGKTYGSTAPFIVGGIIGLGNIVAVGVSGASFNPGLALGSLLASAFVGTPAAASVWLVDILVPYGGAILALLLNWLFYHHMTELYKGGRKN